MESLASILLLLNAMGLQNPENKIERPIQVPQRERIIRSHKIIRQFHKSDSNPSQRRGNR
ncbi:hypothetical protein A3F66_00840 [candidate division TM6 bacterium RIFCSPHIGHO2_12_FULL_32_22]|nr:MAG: hypothetical protein A3F66_00840 [candidate division TM6 bacterium RIFCSPHIGHO2_12_FULL_32_22]